MKLQVYSVFDAAVKAYLPPFYVRAKGEAIRSFASAVNSSESAISKHKGDYTLFLIGEYDDSTGLLTPCNPDRVIGAIEVEGE